MNQNGNYIIAPAAPSLYLGYLTAVPTAPVTGNLFVVSPATLNVGGVVYPHGTALYFNGTNWEAMGTPHAVWGTRAQLQSMLSLGQLNPEVTYFMTDFVRGRLGAAIIKLDVSSNSFSSAKTFDQDVSVLTTFGANAWQGKYDWSSNLITELEDNRGNKVFGSVSVDNFDWGNTAFNRNVVKGTLTTTDNLATFTFNDNVIEPATTVNITGASGFILNSQFSNGANINFSGGTGISINQSRFSSSSITKTVGGSLNIGQSSFDGASMTVNAISTVTVTRSTLSGGANISVTGAGTLQVLYSSVTGLTYITQQGTGLIQINGCSLSGYSYVLSNNTGGMYLNYCNLLTGYIYDYTSGNKYLSYTDITSGKQVFFQNIVNNLYIYYCVFSGNGGSISFNNVQSLTMYYDNVGIGSGVNLTNLTGAGTKVIYSTNVESGGSISCSNLQTLSFQRMNISSNGILQSNGTLATDSPTIFAAEINSGARLIHASRQATNVNLSSGVTLNTNKFNQSSVSADGGTTITATTTNSQRRTQPSLPIL